MRKLVEVQRCPATVGSAHGGASPVHYSRQCHGLRGKAQAWLASHERPRFPGSGAFFFLEPENTARDCRASVSESGDSVDQSEIHLANSDSAGRAGGSGRRMFERRAARASAAARAGGAGSASGFRAAGTAVRATATGTARRGGGGGSRGSAARASAARAASSAARASDVPGRTGCDVPDGDFSANRSG